MHLTPLQAANYLAPDLARFIHIEHYPAESGFGRETRISLNVASTDVRTAALEREGLYHLGHHFSSAELKHAVEQAYPERFIWSLFLTHLHMKSLLLQYHLRVTLLLQKSQRIALDTFTDLRSTKLKLLLTIVALYHYQLFIT